MTSQNRIPASALARPASRVHGVPSVDVGPSVQVDPRPHVGRRVRAALEAGVALAALAVALPTQAAGEAKNVIFFLGDGMGPATVTAARLYRVGETGKLTMETLPRTARIKTFSQDAQTTDSAPSMAAYMTGVKMNNEVLSMSAETRAYSPQGAPYASNGNTTCPAGNGQPVPTLLELAKAAGKGTGNVSTARITHATPAATYAHVCHRDGENDIATQALPGHPNFNRALRDPQGVAARDGVDVLLGGGRQFFLPSTFRDANGFRGRRTDNVDLTAAFQAAGYTYVDTGARLAAIDPSTTDRVLGLFTMDHVDYELDRKQAATNPAAMYDVNKDQPSLAEMTEKAIRILSRNANGYFLMVEGGRIDHALHATNAKRALEDTVAFDDAIKRALSLVDLSNTLVVVTADHDHTMTINGYSHRGNPVLGLTTDVKTKRPVRAADNLPYTTLVFGNGGKQGMGASVTASGGAGPRDATRADPATMDTTADNFHQDVGIPLGTWGSETHGGGDVQLFATGAGRAGFKGTLDNTRVFTLVRQAMGL